MQRGPQAKQEDKQLEAQQNTVQEIKKSNILLDALGKNIGVV